MLNETQRGNLEGTIKFPVDDIIETLKEAKRIDLAPAALEAVSRQSVYDANRVDFERLNILDSIDGLRDIYHHANPQNRNLSNPVDESWIRRGEFGHQGRELLRNTNEQDFDAFFSKYAVWHDAQHNIHYEPLGKLGLTAQNDATAAPPQATDVRTGMDRLFQGYGTQQIQAVVIDELKAELAQTKDLLEIVMVRNAASPESASRVRVHAGTPSSEDEYKDDSSSRLLPSDSNPSYSYPPLPDAAPSRSYQEARDRLISSLDAFHLDDSISALSQPAAPSAPSVPSAPIPLASSSYWIPSDVGVIPAPSDAASSAPSLPAYIAPRPSYLDMLDNNWPSRARRMVPPSASSLPADFSSPLSALSHPVVPRAYQSANYQDQFASSRGAPVPPAPQLPVLGSSEYMDPRARLNDGANRPSHAELYQRPQSLAAVAPSAPSRLIPPPPARRSERPAVDWQSSLRSGGAVDSALAQMRSHIDRVDADLARRRGNVPEQQGR